KEGNIIINPPGNKYVDFDSYPFPARHLLPNDKYYSFISQRKNFTIMLTSTGCPFKCTFCAIPTAYRARTPKNVIEEIELCYREFEVREIDFFDAVLFMPRNRILEICRLLKERNLDIEWSARSRVDVVDEEILKEAASAGCRQIYYGIESVEQDILDSINKRIAPEKAMDTIRLSKKYGIRTMGFFMVGNPGETKETVYKTIDFAKKLKLDFIQVCRTIAKPGTELDRSMVETTERDYWREHIKGIKITHRLPTPWSKLSEQDIESLTKKFYISFYFRPSILFNRLFQLQSFGEFKRYIKVGLKMLLQKSELYSHLFTDTSEAEEVLLKSNKYLDEIKKEKVAVVIPTYNEKENIERIVSTICKILPQAHIVIVDDNSPDGTGDIAKQLSNKNSHIYVIRRKGERGLGLSYKEGFKFILNNLDSSYICQMDADFSHNPQYLPTFLHYARDYDLVTGSRFLRRVSIKNRTIWRNFISKSTKYFVNIFTGINLTDVTSGYKCFRRELLEHMDFSRVYSKGYAFQIEMSHLARKSGANIKEIPILFVERYAGSSKMSAKIMLEGLGLVFKLTLSKLKRIFKK
ncbi:MAG: glycosyltransferase, partial [Candidatus Omnitrophica bacterium]|nr:glycosyltransferase [Candidatus Omnitrophota bacterium]